MFFPRVSCFTFSLVIVLEASFHCYLFEFAPLLENQKWDLYKLSPGKKAIPTRWVYKIKMNPDGTAERFKARLVLLGFSSKKSIAYSQTFAPVARANTIRALFSVAALNNM